MTTPETTTLHHPTIPGATVTVTGKQTADRWRKQGWKDPKPAKAPGPDPE